ncbi:hypothetical protein EC835_11521 [Providencia alcalifaciens]|uniref:Uncharacterized protein n=1 Tax=Providencia alcalifaciens TaxID=126385 RepID=A0A4R3NCV2_9GAMM|nr:MULTISPECIES: hypothetical protein [Providencia]MBC5792380.1 hypothetical protein [Providencia sp. JUb39]TCT28824.1 hypothetical protein EC835_11521 [Providencia alcalifaciens]
MKKYLFVLIAGLFPLVSSAGALMGPLQGSGEAGRLNCEKTKPNVGPKSAKKECILIGEKWFIYIE